MTRIGRGYKTAMSNECYLEALLTELGTGLVWMGWPEGCLPGMVLTLRVLVFPSVLCPLICHNGGVCMKPDRCLCPPDFAGKFCQLHSSGARPPVPAMPGLTRSVYTMPLANHRDDEHGEKSMAEVPSNLSTISLLLRPQAWLFRVLFPNSPFLSFLVPAHKNPCRHPFAHPASRQAWRLW